MPAIRCRSMSAGISIVTDDPTPCGDTRLEDIQFRVKHAESLAGARALYVTFWARFPTILAFARDTIAALKSAYLEIGFDAR